MSHIKVISFDVDGTLVTPDFSYAVWFEGIPALYARRHNVSLDEARELADREYRQIGEWRIEWYDIKYWFERFGLGNYHQKVLDDYRHRVICYPEVPQALSALGRDYKLIIISSSTREFLPYLLSEIEGHFDKVFSTVSDFSQVKTPEFYLEICRLMHITPGEMAHIGDLWDADYIAPTKAGIRAFHLDRKKSRADGSSLTSLSDLESRLREREEC
ncbi:MAG: HAD family hydrolase [Chloroflexi bacterium]|nr:HAD family hydrolase [Chloroflexota bacterium]